MAPLLKLGAFGPFWEYLLSTVIGLFFGYILHRAGFVSARKLTAIFYGKDFAVLRVMFTAIIVAGIGVEYLRLLRIIDIDLIFFPLSQIWPYIAGGLLFGIGFVIGGYCPGTAIVALSNLRLDALAFIIGIMGGVIVFDKALPLTRPFMESSKLGRLTFPELLDVQPAILLFGVVIMAIAVFVIVRRVENALNPEGKRYE